MFIQDFSPEIFNIGFITVRWYSLLFALTFVVGFIILHHIYKRENKNIEDLDMLIIYIMIGTIVGARLGHCLFYEPDYYLLNPVEILKVWKGGLASHGGAIGILTAIYFYSKKKLNYSFLWTADRVVIAVALGGLFIRLGNFINSEIYGIPTDVPWAVIFASLGDNLPRHPTQIYEALTYFLIFILLWTIYKKSNVRGYRIKCGMTVEKSGSLKDRHCGLDPQSPQHYNNTKPKQPQKDGLLFGIFLVLVFASRFMWEFLKEVQSDFERNLLLDMGQILSIPFVLLGIFMIFYSNYNFLFTKRK